MVSTSAMPFFLLFWTKFIRQGEARDAFWASVFLGLQAWVEHIAVFWCVAMGLILLIADARQRKTVKQFCWKHALALAAPFLILATPFLSNAMTMDKEVYQYVNSSLPQDLRQLGLLVTGKGSLQEFNHHFKTNYWFVSQNVSTLSGLITPSYQHPIFKTIFNQHPQDVFECTVYLGWTSLILLLSGLVLGGHREFKVKVWLFLFILFLVFSLGPALRVTSSLFTIRGVPIPLPFLLTQYLPIIRNFRAPARLMVPGMLCLALLAGFGWDRWKKALSDRRKLRFLGGSLTVAGLLLDYLCMPFPLLPFPDIPQVYHEIATVPGECTVLEVPLVIRDGLITYGRHMPVQAQTYQMFHAKNIVSGYISRIPRKTWDALVSEWVINDLVQRQKVPDSFSPLPLEIEKWRAFLQTNQVRYIILHKPVLYPGMVSFFSNWIGPGAAVEQGKDYICFDLSRKTEAEPFWSAVSLPVPEVGNKDFLVNLKTTNEEDALAAIYALSSKFSHPEAVTHKIEMIIADPSATEDLQNMALYSLGKMGPSPKTILFLREALSHGRLRFGAILALGQMGPAARQAVPQLLPFLTDWSLCLPTAKAIARIHPPLKIIRPVLDYCCKQEAWNIKYSGQYLEQVLR